MASFDPFPTFLLSTARNPVTAVGLPLVLGSLSGLPSKKAAEGSWYKSLYFPPGKPSNKIFPIVWPVLYTGLGYAAHIAAKVYDESLDLSSRTDATLALKLYYAQLGLNLSWTPLFFVAKEPGVALLDISVLTGLSLYLTKLLHGLTNGRSTWVLAPYCVWLSYATYLNAGIYWLNRNRHIPKTD